MTAIHPEERISEDRVILGAPCDPRWYILQVRS